MSTGRKPAPMKIRTLKPGERVAEIEANREAERQKREEAAYHIPKQHRAAFAAKGAFLAENISDEENRRRMEADQARDRAIYDAVVVDPTVTEYVDHEQALREHEGEKLNRLQVMLFAQRVRAKFLGLSLADRKTFLDVLTADDGGSMSRMFSLQAEMESRQVTDEELALVKVGRKHHGDAATEATGKAFDKQTRKKEQHKQLLASAQRPALPAGRGLALTQGSRGQ